METEADFAIGIDLGTTYSAAAVYRGGEVVVLENRIGELLTPSVVALDRENDALLIGRPAKELLSLAPERAVAAFKRGMGRESKYELADRELGPVELSACVLRALREDASAALDAEVRRCVVTVPAYFDEEQRFATMKAAELAGLEVLRILNEPTAAAIAYGVHELERDGHFLVFDLGGGTFDVCVMERFAGVLQVKSTAGESRLGGEDFTRRLVNACLGELGLSFEQVELRDPEATGRLLKRGELAKRKLSAESEVELIIPAVAGVLEREVAMTLSREMAEKAWAPLLERLLAPCRSALRGARLDESQLDEVLLVGGATRMPAVRAFVTELFEREPVTDLDPDLAVVHGAAIQAALCVRDEAVEDLVVTDVLSHSLGVDIAKQLGGRVVQGYFSPVIHRNTVIPTSKTDSYYTLEPNQSSIRFRIYEGEARRVEENRPIGELAVKGIPKGPAGQRVDVRFTYDINGILEVEARVHQTGATFSTVLTRDARDLSEKDLKRAQERMAKLKRDPREEPRVRDLLLRAESIWRDLPGESKPIMGQAMDAFESALESGDREAVRRGLEWLTQICDELDGGERW